jgi:hypothetical protein
MERTIEMLDFNLPARDIMKMVDRICDEIEAERPREPPKLQPEYGPSPLAAAKRIFDETERMKRLWECRQAARETAEEDARQDALQELRNSPPPTRPSPVEH